jgi:hypothetical protein
MKPYVYKLTGKDGSFYFGVRWYYETTPEEDLFKNYFTSSNSVKKIIEEEGLNFFKTEILQVFETKEDALQYEYNLIKGSLNDNLCLNRSLGKCTIWNDELKSRLSESMKKRWKDYNYRNNRSNLFTSNTNPNKNKPSWRNLSSCVASWMKSKEIYDDFQKEGWDLEKYGFGRKMLVVRYSIKEGTARNLIKKFRESWSPYEDQDFLNFYEENLGK